VRDHKPIVLEEFNGLWKRGDKESTPLDHFADCNNIQFIESGFETRDGIDPVYETVLKNILRIHPYTTQESQDLLILTSGGNIIHYKPPGTFIGPIKTIATMTDFNVVSIAGRAYITPFFTNAEGKEVGISGEFLYVYSDTITIRKAAGFPPTNGSDLPWVTFNSQITGGWDKGVHVIAVAFQVAGIDGIKGPEVFSVVLAPGGKQIQLTNIPIGPVGTTQRIIVATRAIDPKDYIANQLSYTYYEVIRIPDNTTVNLAVSITDAALVLVYVEGASAAPVTNALLAANSSVDGFNDFGFHLFGVVYETDTGYLTRPGPEFFAGLTTIDIKKRIDLYNIPVSPDTFVTKRHIVATRVIPNYNGDQYGYQFFFVPGGNIDNNVATTTSVSFYDSDLLEDASHLFDNFSEIPAGVGLTTYHGRLVLTTTFTDISLAYLSHPGEPEAIDQVDGLVIAPLDGNPLTNCQEFRDILYLFKQTRTIACADNNDVPSTWIPIVLDQALGAPVHGISAVLDSGGVNLDFLLVADLSGVVQFNGVYSLPELTYKINDYWKGLDKSLFRKIELLNDPITKRIFCVLPTNTLLLGDYSLGLTPKTIRWAPWSYDIPITTLELHNVETVFLGATPNISNYSGFYKIVDGKTHDTLYNLSDVLANFKFPNPTIQTAFVNESGSARENKSSGENINHYASIRLRANGAGNLIPKFYGLDEVETQTLVSLPMSSTPGREPTRLANFQQQRALLELKTTEIDETMRINRIIIYARPVFVEFPG